MAAIPLPVVGPLRLLSGAAELGEMLLDAYRIEVPITMWPVEAASDAGSATPASDAGSAPSASDAGSAPPASFVRISAQRYNDIDQYATLAAALVDILSGSDRSADPA